MKAMKSSVMAAALLLVALFASAAWAESVELPAYHRTFDEGTTATFEMPAGWSAELFEIQYIKAWELIGKIDGTPLEFVIRLQPLSSREKSSKDEYKGATARIAEAVKKIITPSTKKIITSSTTATAARPGRTATRPTTARSRR